LSLEFLLTSIIVVLLPGTGVIFTVSTGLTYGARASIFAAIGCTFGIVPHLCASVFGLAAILYTSSLVFQIFKLIGVIYLVFLAWSMWKESGIIEFKSIKKDVNYLRIITRGFLINILNPKLSIFFLAFLPQFVTSTPSNALTEMLSLSAIFMILTFVVFVFYGLLANQVRSFITNSPNFLEITQKFFAGLFLALGVKLALTDR